MAKFACREHVMRKTVLYWEHPDMMLACSSWRLIRWNGNRIMRSPLLKTPAGSARQGQAMMRMKARPPPYFTIHLKACSMAAGESGPSSEKPAGTPIVMCGVGMWNHRMPIGQTIPG